MIQDILTVMWKEQRCLFRSQGSRIRTILGLVGGSAGLSVVLPLQMGRDWLHTAWSLIAAILVPYIVVGIMTPESFAGERERRTLESLLASRLPDRAIVFGKMLWAVACGWAATLVVLAVSLVVANLVRWTGHLEFYRPAVALVDVTLSLVLAGMAASLGVLVSLRAATVQGATQALMLGLMAPLVVLQIGAVLLLKVVPDGRRLLEKALSADLRWIAFVLCAGLLVMTAGLLLAAVARFKRGRLISD